MRVISLTPFSREEFDLTVNGTSEHLNDLVGRSRLAGVDVPAWKIGVGAAYQADKFPADDKHYGIVT